MTTGHRVDERALDAARRIRDRLSSDLELRLTQAEWSRLTAIIQVEVRDTLEGKGL